MMKKWSMFLMLVLLAGISPAAGAGVTADPSVLEFAKIWMEGSRQAGMTQRLHVTVVNTSIEDYHGWWNVVDLKTGKPLNSVDASASVWSQGAEVPAFRTVDVTMEFQFSGAGRYELGFNTVDDETELFRYTVDIAEYTAPRLSGSITVDMLEQTDDGNFLYGDLAHFRITGTTTLTNHEDYTILGWGGFQSGGGDGIQVVVWPWFGDNNWYYPWFYNLGHELKAGETITTEFSYEFTAVPEAGKDYGIELDVLGITVARISFTPKQCTNTYWTAERRVKPLPEQSGQVLKIPGEALAVDLRGLYGINTVFAVDASEANPNCLYYLDFLDYVPQGLGAATNIIRDYEAKTLSIDAAYGYYCPMPFRAKTALFHYTPVSEAMGPARAFMSQVLSGALVLPFGAQRAWLDDLNNGYGEDGFYRKDMRVLRYVNHENTALFFSPVMDHQLQAYEPYLMYMLPSPVTFYAEEVTVPSTRDAIVSRGDVDFVGFTTATVSSEGFLSWYCDVGYFYQAAALSQIRPFSAMMDARRLIADILTVNVESTPPVVPSAIRPATMSAEDMLPVYSLSGQRVGTTTLTDGCPSTEGLRPGLYIIGGRKVVVR